MKLELEVRGIGTKLYRISDRSNVVGRSGDCDIIVNDVKNSVSRRHCVFGYDNVGFYVEDSKSRNGTFLNQERLEERGYLRDGDVVALANAFDGVAIHVQIKPRLVERLRGVFGEEYGK